MEATQIELLLPAKKREEIPDQMVFKCADLLAAIRLMVNTSGYEKKQIAMELTLSEGHLSEILSGKKNFPLHLLDTLMDLCESEIPLKWWVDKRGFELKAKISRVEKENMELKRKMEHMTELLRDILGKG